MRTPHRLHRVLLAAAMCVVVLAMACDGDAPPSASGTECPPSIADWVDFVHWDGVTYLRAQGSAAPGPGTSALGATLGTVQFRLSGNECHLPEGDYVMRQGDAAFLDAGTALREVAAYDPQFRLAAVRDGEVVLYEADTNPSATRGADLLDIGGRVQRVGVNSPVDGVTEVAAIEDAVAVEELVQMVLDAPVDQAPRDRDGERVFLAFHLDDGTTVVRAYAPASGELSRGIWPPPAFAEAVRGAIAAPASDSAGMRVASVTGVASPEGFELLVTSVPFHPGFPPHRAPDRLDRVSRDAQGAVVVETLLAAEELGVDAFRLGFESVVANASGETIVVAVCGRGDCGGFGPPSADALTVLHRSTDGGQTWARYGEIEGGAWLVGIADQGVIVREPVLAGDVPNDPARAVRFVESGEAVSRPATAAALPFVSALGAVRWWSSGGDLLDAAGDTVERFPLDDPAERFRRAPLADGASTVWTWTEGDRDDVFAALFGVGGVRLSPVWIVPYGCCASALSRDHVLVPATPLPPSVAEQYGDTLPAMAGGGAFARATPALLDPWTGEMRLLADPFLGAAYSDRDEITVIAVRPGSE